MDASNTPSAYEKVRAKHIEKKHAAAERKAERIEQGITNKLVIERAPAGLYSCRYKLSGPVPDCLKGYFTRKDRILAIAKQRGIEVES
jgi:hypothetical protein